MDFAHFGLTMSKNIGADWKIKGFPDTFGWIMNTSRPPTNISSASRCKSIWNVSKILFVSAIFCLQWSDQIIYVLIYSATKICGRFVWLAKTNKRILTHPAVPSGEERGLHFPNGSWSSSLQNALVQGIINLTKFERPNWVEYYSELWLIRIRFQEN